MPQTLVRPKVLNPSTVQLLLSKVVKTLGCGWQLIKKVSSLILTEQIEKGHSDFI